MNQKPDAAKALREQAATLRRHIEGREDAILNMNRQISVLVRANDRDEAFAAEYERAAAQLDNSGFVFFTPSAGIDPEAR